VTDDLHDLLDTLAPVARRLGCAEELASIATIIEHGASYQRQLAVAHANGGSLQAVVSSLAKELRHGVQPSA
jgi:carboxylate-amine ligase